MKMPQLQDYGLTEERLKKYEQQCHRYYEAEHIAIEKKKKNIKKAMVVLLVGSILLGIILAVINADSDVWIVYLLSPLAIVSIPLVIMFQSVDSVRLSKNKLQELNSIIDGNLKIKCEEYYNKQIEYERYIKKCQRDFWVSLNGYEFENEVASVFSQNGYSAYVTKKTGDGGVDIVLERNNERIAVQCKHHKNKVGPNDVRALQGVVSNGNYSYGIFVSLNGFTPTVFKEVNNGKVRIVLITLDDLLLLYKNTYK